MSDQDFRERVLSTLERLEQKSERLEEKFDKKFASMEEKFDKKFASMEEKVDKRSESIETRLGLLEQSVSWIRGKLEGNLETGTVLWARIAVATAIASAIIALFALFRS